jgi:triacylglycerol lipase
MSTTPSPAVAYSPLKVDLYTPCKNAKFFSAGPPRSDAALCAEMARLAYCRNDGDFAFDRARTRSVLAGIGYEVADGNFYESNQTSHSGGTHCFLAVNPVEQAAVLSFRGTDANDPTDLVNDIDARPIAWEKGGRVHKGFADAVSTVRGGVMQAITSFAGRLLITGHSLGAAMATLTASLKTPAALYTFGSPRVGDSAFVDALSGVRNFRYVDCCDIVTRVPPKLFGYRHLGKPYYIARDRSITLDPGDSFIRKDQDEASAEYIENQHILHKDIVGLRELADHAPVNYVSAVTAAAPPSQPS